MPIQPELADASYCYLTTTGRVTGRPHTVEIWFAIEGETVYMLSGGRDRADWVKNSRRAPDVAIRIGERHFKGRARVVDRPDEDARARELLLGKYRPRYSGDLTDWGRTALPVAVDIEGSD